MLRWLSEREQRVVFLKSPAANEKTLLLDLLMMEANDDVFFYTMSFVVHPIRQKERLLWESS